MKHLRHLPNRAVELVVGVFDGAERLHWRIVRARAGAFAPIAAAFARRYRAVRDGLAPPDADRIRIGVVPRVLAGAVGLVAIVAVSTALAPSSSSEAVPRNIVGVAGKKASKSIADSGVAGRSVSAIPSRKAKPALVRVRAVAPRRITAPAKPRLVAQRVVNQVPRAQSPRMTAPVTTPPPPAPQPVSPAPQPPAANEANEEQHDGDNDGPGSGDQGGGGGKDEGEEDEDKDKDKDKDKEDDEDDESQPPPPPDDEDDDG